MNEDYRARLDKAAEQHPEVRKRMRNWKKRKPKQLDQLFHQAHDEVFQRSIVCNAPIAARPPAPSFAT